VFTRASLVLVVVLLANAARAEPPAKASPAPAPTKGSGVPRKPDLKRPPPDPEPTTDLQPAPAAAPTPLRLRAESLAPDGPPLKLVSTGVAGQFALTADGAWLVYLDSTGLFALPTRDGAPRKLAPSTLFFTLTPDSRFALVPEAAWTRLSLSGKDGPVVVARGEALHQLSGFSVSKRHVAFIAADGSVVVAALDEGTARRLSLEPPKDTRCHAGAGYPRGFSDDGEWLLLQRGCTGLDAVHPDGSGLHRLPTGSGVLVGNLVVGQRLLPDSGLPMEKELVVTPLKGGDGFTIRGANLSPFAKAMPGNKALLQDDGEGRLTLVDLEKKLVRVLYEGAVPVLPFFEPTPDGQRALFATRSEGHCTVNQVDVATGKRQQLADVEGAEQCFIKPAGNARAVLYAWRSGEAVLASIELKTGVVRRLGQPLSEVGNFQVSEGAVVVTAGQRLLLGRP
jgi:hypothetical protein